MTLQNKPSKKTTAISQRRTKRGRPQKYSESWIKKLILLRYCGLKLPVILELLDSLGNGSTKLKHRRAQQIIRDLLADDHGRYPNIDKNTARRRSSFVRAAIGRGRELRVDGQKLAARSRSSSYSSRIDCALEPWVGASQRVSMLPYDNPYYASEDFACMICRSISSLEHIAQTNTNVGMAKSFANALHNESRKSEDSASKMSISDTSHRRRPRVRDAISRPSLSSSYLSDISSILKARSSISSKADSSLLSHELPANADDVDCTLHSTISTVLSTHRYLMEQANTMLIQQCCSQVESCIHKAIASLVRLIPKPRINMTRHDPPMWLTGAKDIDGDLLFFAARVAAPLEILLYIIRNSTDVNRLNAEGQTFMFYLDPENLPGRTCDCFPADQLVAPHDSAFECLVAALERRSFDFDRIDNRGRHFLSYVCHHESFDLSVLTSMVAQREDWNRRLEFVKQFRDSHGLFLRDFVALSRCPTSPNVGDLSAFQPQSGHIWFQTEERVLTLGITTRTYSQNSEGEYKVHELDSGSSALWEEEFPQILENKHDLGAYQLEIFRAVLQCVTNVNRYDRYGRTPVMAFLRSTHQEWNEFSICDIIQQFLNQGLNVDACSRDGTTILQLAVQCHLPQVVELLLSANANPHHRNDDGRNAMDIASAAIKQSRQSKYPATLMGRSLRAATRLLEFDPRKTARQRKTLDCLQKHIGNAAA
ncbi:hypothetical protein NX059_000020 [Plenodomus lindquistii]|nr:hypothetical protein NX059_000020 [Plenodomus lindquistii]